MIYLVKHSRLGNKNVTRKFSNIMDGVNQAMFLVMHQIIKYVLETRNLELKLELKSSEKEPWDIVFFSNSN